MDFMDFAEKLIICFLIFAVIIFILGLIGYCNQTELERCMHDYNDYDYCKRYDVKEEE